MSYKKVSPSFKFSLPDSSLLLDHELVPGVTPGVGRDPTDHDVLAVPALEHPPPLPLVFLGLD